MTSAELRAERYNARVTETPYLQEKRMPTEHSIERLKLAIGRMRKSPDFATIRQFIVAEGSEDQPDYSGLRRLILETFASGLDLEIEALREKRRKESA